MGRKPYVVRFEVCICGKWTLVLRFYNGFVIITVTLFFAPALCCIPFLGSYFSLSWFTPYLINHIVKQLPENEYLEIKFFQSCMHV